jgi:hypothetical protein
VQVGLGADGRPEVATYSQHEAGEARDWADVAHDQGDHPIVYVAPLSHACYFEAGAHPYLFGIDNPGRSRDGGPAGRVTAGGGRPPGRVEEGNRTPRGKGATSWLPVTTSRKPGRVSVQTYDRIRVTTMTRISYGASGGRACDP